LIHLAESPFKQHLNPWSFSMPLHDFGLIGLAVMGANLALNIAEKGFSISVYNRNRARTESFMQEEDATRFKVHPTYALDEFVNSLALPRRILIMVQSSASSAEERDAVDQVIEQLKPLLSPGDIVIDGGNSFFKVTERRTQELEAVGLHFFGMGVSGGEEGARHGPSLMPGGDQESYEKFLAPILTAIAAKAEDGDGACVTHIGRGGAGHYVKMVHNGIEYGDMQLIAEAYDLLKSVAGLDHNKLHDVFSEWNKTDELKSYLIEITAQIFKRMDPETHEPLVELILDQAGQKGTGRWTVMSALELGVPIPTMIAAVNARIASSYKAERVAASRELAGPGISFNGGNVEVFINQVRDALYCSKMCSYAQGMALLSKASQEHQFGLTLSELARIWKGGCIIRAGFLDKIKRAFNENPDLPNLLLAPEFKQTILERQMAWREVVAIAARMGIPVPAFSASLDYFDSYRRDRLPQNLTQAQRDFFGAHTYQRTDKEGTFHTEWTQEVLQTAQ
jgi:6-phosphogluconate dehydrogenase